VSLAVLNLLRVIALLLLVPAYILAAMATLSVSTPESPNHLLALLVFLVLFSIAVLIWSIVNWMLSLASIYATVARASLFQALRDAWLLLRSRTSQLAAPREVWVAASTMPPAVVGDPDEDDAVMPPIKKESSI